MKSLSIFELLTYLERISIQLFLNDKSFPVVYLSDYFIKYTTTWVVQIEMVPI